MPKDIQQLPKYVCGYCQKGYVLKKYYDNHTTFCKIRHQTAQETKDNINDEDSHLSLKDLNKIVRKLVIKTDKMEKEIKHLLGFVDKTLKCANIVELLNQTHDPSATISDFNIWYQEIEVKEQHLDLFFKTNYAEALFKIIASHMSSTENIKAFVEKPNKLFVYSNESWIELSKDDFYTFVSTLRKKIMKTFQIWQIANRDAILNGDDGHEDYADKVIRIMGGNKSELAIANAIRERLYNKIKTEMKSMTKIEL